MESLLKLKKSDSVLFLAEGNFSFSVSVVEFWSKNNSFELPKIAATCFEEKPVSKIAEENVEKLKNFGVRVLFSADATKCCDIASRLGRDFVTFSKVFFMFPHVGGKSKIHLNRQLLKSFAESISKNLQSTDSRIFVALCGGQGGTCFDPIQRVPGDTWQVIAMMSYGDFQVVQVDFFDLKVFPEYRSFGYRGLNKGFHSEKGIVHVFEPSPLSPDFLSTFDQAYTVEELQEKYIDEKIDQFFNRKTPIWKCCEKLVHKLSSVDFIDEHLIDKSSSVILRDKFETVEISEDSAISCILKPVFLADFSFDFSKCPVTVCLFVGPFEDRNVVSKVMRNDQSKFTKEFSMKNGEKALLVDLSSSAMNEESLENWQQLWSIKTLLEPQSYSHDLAYTFDPATDRRHISEAEMSTVLWTMGFDTVTDFNLFDVYIDSDNITSNTIRLNFLSHQFPMSRDKVWTIHYQKIGATLAKLFNVTLR